jgi:hypothetical protein
MFSYRETFLSFPQDAVSLEKKSDFGNNSLKRKKARKVFILERA